MIEIILNFDPDTDKVKLVSQRIIDDTIKKVSKKKTIKSEIDNPGIIREDGKLILSEEAISLLNAQPDDKIFIGYDKFGSSFKPFIGIDDKKGNKLTKSNTVSYRGKSNVELAYYGSEFKLVPGKHENTYYLEGNVIIDISVPEGIEVDEDPISDDLLADLDLDQTNTKKITSFTFSDIDLE